jgi:hypothetical protein
MRFKDLKMGDEFIFEIDGDVYIKIEKFVYTDGAEGFDIDPNVEVTKYLEPILTKIYTLLEKAEKYKQEEIKAHMNMLACYQKLSPLEKEAKKQFDMPTIKIISFDIGYLLISWDVDKQDHIFQFVKK